MGVACGRLPSRHCSNCTCICAGHGGAAVLYPSDCASAAAACPVRPSLSHLSPAICQLKGSEWMIFHAERDSLSPWQQRFSALSAASRRSASRCRHHHCAACQ